VSPSLGVIPFLPHQQNNALFDSSDGPTTPAVFPDVFPLLRESLQAKGWRVNTADLCNPPTHVDVWLHLNCWGGKPWHTPWGRTILMMFEPRVVAPYWYRRMRAAARRYPVIFTPYIDLVRRGAPFRYLHFPQDVSVDTSQVQRSEFLVMINTRLYGTHRHSLYGERERIATWMARHADIALYGAGWQTAKFYHPLSAMRTPALRRVAKGRVESKFEVLARARFVLCFENSRIAGYRTEKLFNALAAGAIPIYAGDPTMSSVVPPDAFIHYERFRGPKELWEYLVELSDEEVAAMRASGQGFLASEAFLPYRAQSFVNELIATVEEVARL
jgi:hypothetical protein